MQRRKKNFRRKRILDENMLDYIDICGGSERNKEIIVAYANGENYNSIAEKHGISSTRVEQIVMEYVLKVIRNKN